MVRVDDAVIGPVTFDQISRGSAAGKIPKGAEVRAVGSSQWLPLWAILRVPQETRERLSEPPPAVRSAPPADPSWSGFGGGRPPPPASGSRLPPPKAPRRKGIQRRGAGTTPGAAAGVAFPAGTPSIADPDSDDDATVLSTPDSEKLWAAALRAAPLPSQPLQQPPPSSATRAATPQALGSASAAPFFMVFTPGSAQVPVGPVSLADINARYARGLIADNAIVCEVDEKARWITLLELIAR